MESEGWFNKPVDFAPGRELFRSDRRFYLCAYTVSHSQLLFRSATWSPERGQQSRIDILFKPVDFLRTQTSYDGIVVRCATAEERERIFAGYQPHSWAKPADDQPLFMLETINAIDYVASSAMGWKEDDEDERDPSALAFFVPGTDPTRLLPTGLTTPWSRIQFPPGE